MSYGPVPLGYRVVKGRLEPVEDELRTVRRIFTLRKKGYSLGKIVAELNRARVPTKKGGLWRPATIAAILKNPLHSEMTR